MRRPLLLAAACALVFAALAVGGWAALHALYEFADLKAEGIEVRPAGANLEDVFVTLSRAASSANGGR